MPVAFATWYEDIGAGYAPGTLVVAAYSSAESLPRLLGAPGSRSVRFS